MMLYKDLDLRKLREECGLDFAHYTYKPGQCSCCYGPKDMASIHWKDRVIPEGDDYTYLLFKNADNGSGHVKAHDTIGDRIYIEWGFPEDKMKDVINSLSSQLSDEYIVLQPKTRFKCIQIRLRNEFLNDMDDFDYSEAVKRDYVLD